MIEITPEQQIFVNQQAVITDCAIALVAQLEKEDQEISDEERAMWDKLLLCNEQ
jgi:hypothetical protein